MNEQLTVTEEKVTCSDCGRWEYRSSARAIKHSSRCDTPNAQFEATQNEKEANKTFAKVGQFSKESPGSGLTSDELYDAYKRGFISQSDAMNTDF